MVQAVARRLNLNSPSGVTASTDKNIIQILSLAQEEGISLMRRHPWTVLTMEKTFTGTADDEQTGAIPSDFDRFIDESFYNRTQRRPVEGPISPQDWQQVQATTATTLIESYRVRGTSILITPTPNGTDTYAYEYISENWCASSGGTGQAAWAADTDVGVLDEELMTLGIEWRFKAAKGFDYSELFRTYELSVADKFLRDGGKRRLSFGSRRSRRPGIFVPEGSWSL